MLRRPDGAMTAEASSGERTFRRAITLLAVFCAGVMGAVLVGSLVMLSATQNVVYNSISIKHFPVTIGLPLAALASLALVFLLEYARGPVEFEMPGFKFKGAAGPLVMWVMVYLAMAATFGLLWDKTATTSTADTMMNELTRNAIFEARLDHCRAQLKLQTKDSAEIDSRCAAMLAGTADIPSRQPVSVAVAPVSDTPDLKPEESPERPAPIPLPIGFN